MIELKLHNSASHEKQLFVPQDSAHITMYVCGPTVYSTPHIGNARPAVAFDVLFRLLRHLYGPEAVHYARNITDIDDKIITSANTKDISIEELTNTTIKEYHAAISRLNVLAPTYEPKATSYVDNIIEFVNHLIANGHAYEINGEVFFAVDTHKGMDFVNHSALNVGERIAVNPNKKNPHDFVLWKPSKPNKPYWDSPWGAGRPGWHIECSTMIEETLGRTIDIHGGGQDLRFPHHACENMQSHAHNGVDLARYWLHNGLLTVDGKKMSKSLGNTIYLENLFKRYPGESIRMLFLTTHYRSPLDFTDVAITQAHQNLYKFYDFWSSINYIEGDSLPFPNIVEALADDMNTPLAITHLHKWVEVLERKPKKEKLLQFVASMKLLGFYSHKDHWFKRDIDVNLVENLVSQRHEARLNKNWAESDRLRDILLNMGVTVADGPKGTVWRWN